MEPANNPPVANPDQASTTQGTPVTVLVLANDTDPDDGDQLSITGVSLETTVPGGSASADPEDGTVTVDPGSTFTGTIEVVYMITDNGSPPATASGTLTVLVVAGNPPVVVDDEVTTQRGVPVTVDVLANDSDPDGDALTVTNAIFVTVQPAGASLRVNDDGRTITVDPGPGDPTSFDIGYTVRDETGLENAGRLRVTVVETSPGGTVTVDVVSDAGVPMPGLAAGFRLGEGAWMPTQTGSAGDIQITVPSGESRFGVMVRSGDIVKVVEATTNETMSVRVTLSDVAADLVDFSFDWVDADELADGVIGLILNGLAGFVAQGSGASGSGTVPQYPAEPQDFLLLATDDGVPVGVDIQRGVTPTQGGIVSFDYEPADMGGSAPVDPFTVQAGFSGFFAATYNTGAGSAQVGGGTNAGGVFYTVPSSQSDPDDMYVMLGVATSGSADVSHTIVQTDPNVLSASPIGVPGPWTGVNPPVPDAFPTFTDLSSTDPDHQLFQARIIRTLPNDNPITWVGTFTQGWLGNATTYTVGDPTSLPGFEDFAFDSGDLVLFILNQFSSNRTVGELLSVRTAGGVPLIDGLSLTSASVNGSYAVP